MKIFIIAFLAVGHLSSFAVDDKDVYCAKAKLVSAINSSVPFKVSVKNLSDISLRVATFDDRFAKRIQRKFGHECITQSFGGTNKLRDILSLESVRVDEILAPILENCYSRN